eukprot:54475_1
MNSLNCQKIRLVKVNRFHVLKFHINHLHKMHSKSISNYGENHSAKTLRNQRVFKTKENKKLRDEQQTISPAKRATNIDNPTIQLIRNCRHHDVVQLVQEHYAQIKDASTFTIAMKTQNPKDFNGVEHIIKLMDLMLSSKLPLNVVAFGVFFNFMYIADMPEISKKYFDLMVNNYDITPDYKVFPILIKGCRSQGKFQLAKEYWNLMKFEYNIVPSNSYIYTEMILVCAASGEFETGKIIFEEYLARLTATDVTALPYNIVTFDVFLGLLADAKDEMNINHTLKLLSNYEPVWNKVTMTHVMKAFLKLSKPKQSIEELRKWMEKGGHPSVTSIYLKCVAFCHIMAFDDHVRNNWKLKEHYFKLLRRTISAGLDNYQTVTTRVFFSLELKGAILLYYNKNPTKIVDVFESLVVKKKMEYCRYDGLTQTMAIDLHDFDFDVAQFLLRYCIGYKLNDIKLMSNSDHLVLIVGKSKHNARNKLTMRQFVQDELLKYDPPISCKTHVKDFGTFVVDYSSLAEYLNNDMNYAKRKLIEIHDEWFLDDLRYGHVIK